MGPSFIGDRFGGVVETKTNRTITYRGKEILIFVSHFCFSGWRFYDLQTVGLSQFRQSVFPREVKLALFLSSFSLFIKQVKVQVAFSMYVCLCFLYFPEFNDLDFTYQLRRFQTFKNKGDLGFLDYTFS